MTVTTSAPKKPRSKVSPDRDAISCAGQGCKDKQQCERYRRHAAWIGQRWASFDVERIHFARVEKLSYCPSFVKF